VVEVVVEVVVELVVESVDAPKVRAGTIGVTPLAFKIF
jgi:hypothetical protein